MKKEMSQLTAKMAQIKAYLMGENAKLEADLVGERERNRELETKIAQTKRENDDLEAQLRARNTEARHGKARIGELEGKINALQSKNSDLENQIQCEQKERNDEFMKINSKISQSDDRSTKIGADLKAEIDSGVAEMSRTISELKVELQSERENKTAEIVKLEADLNRTMNLLDLHRDGWSYLAKTASWYKIIDQNMTFEEAEAYCAGRKIHLVSIHSQEESDLVWKLANAVASSIGFWIGMKRDPSKGNAFEWMDGSSVDFTNWDEGHPNSRTHAVLRRYDGKWQAGSPTFHWRFICKRSSQF